MTDATAVGSADTTAARPPAAVLALAVVAVAGALLLLAPGALLGYDAAFHVLWGADLVSGRVPDFEALTTPTPHPLQLLLAVLVAPLGDAAPDAFRIAHLLSAGVLAVAVVEIGRRLVSLPVGVLAAVLLVATPYVAELGHRAQADLPALALVACAAALELRLPRRGVLVLLVLLAAGLLRPEVWLLALAYATWCGRGRAAATKLRLVAMALVAPAIWALVDLAVAGDPLHSFNRTREITDLIGRETGVRNGLRLAPQHLEEVLGPGTLVVAAGGAAAGLLLLRRAVLGPLAVAVAGGAAFMVLAVARLSLQPRYLLVTAAALAVLAAIGTLGWTALPGDDRRRRGWRLGGGLALLVLLAGAVAQAGDARETRAQLAGGDDRELAVLLDRPRARATLARCRAVGVANAAMLPHVAQTLGIPPTEVRLVPRRGGAYVAPTATGRSSVGGGVEGVPRAFVPPPPVFRPVLRTRSWQLAADDC